MPVRCLWILIVFVTFVDLRAWILLGVWYLSQFFMPIDAGVAWPTSAASSQDSSPYRRSPGPLQKFIQPGKLPTGCTQEGSPRDLRPERTQAAQIAEGSRYEGRMRCRCS